MRLRWSPWCLVALMCLTVALFILAWAFPVFPGDEAALLRFQGFQTQGLTAAAVAISLLGSTPIMLGMVGVTTVPSRCHRCPSARDTPVDSVPHP